MKKLLFLLSFAVGAHHCFAQSTANYAFTTGITGSLLLDANGNAIDMSTGTTQVLTTSTSQDQSINASAITFPASFDFYVAGKRFNSFFATSNGLVQLGATQSIIGSIYTIASGTTVAPRLSAFAADLGTGTAGGLFGKLIGTAPNRCYVIEFRNMNLLWSNTYTNDGTWQVRFYESTGVIEYVYGTMFCNTTVNAGDATPETGFTFGSAVNQTLSINFSTLNPDRSGVIFQNTVTAGTNITNLNSGADGSRTVFSFTPPVVAAPTGLNATAVAGSSMDLNWTDNSANELGFTIYRSTDNINFTYVTTTAANATTYSATGLSFATTYYWKVSAVSEGALSTAATLTQATNPPTLIGTRTVGTGGDYANLTIAFGAIITNGLAGDLQLQLISGYPASAESYPIAGPNATATGNFGTLIYPAVSGLSVSSSNTTGTLNLNSTTNLTIDGRVNRSGANDLVIANTNIGASYAVQFINDARNNTLSHLVLQSANTSTTSGTVVIGNTTGPAGNDNITIDNCDIKDGVANPANAIFSQGTSTTTAQFNDNVTISNNNIYNYFSATLVSAGILAALGNSAWTITNNKLYQTASRTYTSGNTHYGILVNASSGSGFTVSSNTIGFANNSGSGVYTLTGAVATRFVGIYISAGTATPSSVQGNTISGISLTTASNASTVNGIFAGINIINGSVNVGNLIPNVIGAVTGTGAISTTSSTTAGLVVGINSSSTGVTNISNNLIGSLTANGATASISASVTGIQVSAGTPTINGNTIGSTTTNNSINSPTVATTGSQFVKGIDVTAGVTTSASIQSNTIANLNQNGTTTGAYIRAISFAGSGLATISGNTIYKLSGANTNVTVAGAATAVQGILHTGAATGATLNNNVIYTLSATNTGAVQTNVTGIGYSNPTNGTINGNTVYDLQNASTMAVATTPPTASGILVRALANSVQLSNNMVSLGNAQTTNTQFIGIWNSFATPGAINIYHNSVAISGTAASGALPSFGILRGDNTAASAITTPVDIKNNIFSNTRSGGTGKHYAIGNVNAAPATAWGSTASNKNVFNGAVANIGSWGLAADQPFSGWQAISTGDAASFSGIALPFTNIPTADLHLTFGMTPTPVESGGVAVGVSTDFDGQSRPGPAGSVNGGGFLPDIGADEIDAVPTASPLPIKVQYLRGTKTSTSHILSWQVVPVNTANAVLSLERSMDGRTFNALYTITATASRMTSAFTYANNDVLNGINYYRLKMTDDNGIVSYSDIVALTNTGGGFTLVSINPDPVLSTAMLRVSAAMTGKLQVTITDISGKKLSEQNVSVLAGSNSIALDVNRLIPGTYIVTASCPSCGKAALTLVKL